MSKELRIELTEICHAIQSFELWWLLAFHAVQHLQASPTHELYDKINMNSIFIINTCDDMRVPVNILPLGGVNLDDIITDLSNYCPIA